MTEDAAARRRAKILNRGVDRLAQLQQPLPPPSVQSSEEAAAAAAADMETSGLRHRVKSSDSEPVEPIGESLLNDSGSFAAGPGTPLSTLFGGGSNAAVATRMETSAIIKSVVVGSTAAALGWTGESLLGPALSWLVLLWILLEFTMRFVQQNVSGRAEQPSGILQLGAMVFDRKSIVYGVAGRLCVFVFAFVVALELRTNVLAA